MIELVKKYRTELYPALILLIAFGTYALNYFNPPSVFWDENYHIASAQKYIEGVMYMEPHPPLGKLFIALGEWLVHPNDSIDLHPFTQTDYIKTFPKDYSFAGVRLFSTLFAALSAYLFFFILYRIGKNYDIAFLFSSFYLFENAFILQSRAAMLEGIQIFFVFAALWYFLVLFDKEKNPPFQNYFGLGVLIGLATAVKLNGLILALLPLFLFMMHAPSLWKPPHRFIFALFRDAAATLAAIALVLVAVFYIHAALGEKLSHKHYKASERYLKLIKEGQTANPLYLPVILKDNLNYMKGYSKGVPRYDPCKKGENGSLAATWPFMNKTINYRWSKKDGQVRYLYLIGNPLVWFTAFLGVFLATVLVVGRFFFQTPMHDARLFKLLSFFLLLYVVYMATMFNIERVMYLYHYFLPLFFAIFTLFTLFLLLFKEAIAKNSKILYAALIIFVLEIVACYFFFAPLTYYNPLTTYEFLQRSWFDFWHLKPVL